jgi:membrane-bound serine protease (ClpP class)
VIATIAVVSGGFFFFVARFAVSVRHLSWAGGTPALVGATGVAKSDIGPKGVAYVAGEDWSVRTEGGPITKGTAVRVKRKEGLSLIVEPSRDSSPGGGAS